MVDNIRYDPFQQEAIDCIRQGHSVIVSAPTGAGKTVIAEYVIQESIAKGDTEKALPKIYRTRPRI